MTVTPGPRADLRHLSCRPHSPDADRLPSSSLAQVPEPRCQTGWRLAGGSLALAGETALWSPRFTSGTSSLPCVSAAASQPPCAVLLSGTFPHAARQTGTSQLCAPATPAHPWPLGFRSSAPGPPAPSPDRTGLPRARGGSDSPCLTSSTGWGLSGCLCGLAELRSAGCSPTKPPSDTAHGLRQSAAEGEATLWVRKPRAVCSLLRGPMLACQRPHSVQGFGLLTGLGRSLISGAVTSGHNKQRA